MKAWICFDLRLTVHLLPVDPTWHCPWQKDFQQDSSAKTAFLHQKQVILKLLEVAFSTVWVSIQLFTRLQLDCIVAKIMCMEAVDWMSSTHQQYNVREIMSNHFWCQFYGSDSCQQQPKNFQMAVLYALLLLYIF